jgi:uncharacterized protein
MAKKKVLILGDTAQAKWHFLDKAEPALREVLGDVYDLTFTEAYPALTVDDLRHHDLVVNYIDNWAERGTVEAGVALQTFVSTGGQLLCLHSGIIQRKPFFLQQMQGGAFTKHEAYATLNYRNTEVDHPVTQGVGPFSMGEEPYEFLLDPLTERTLLQEYELNGTVYPAAWVIDYGMGRIVYLAQGHDARSFEVPGFRRLIRNSALWLCPVE